MSGPRRYGSPTPRYTTGPFCGAHVRPDGTAVPECPYRKTSQGYVPPTSPEIQLVDGEGTVHETHTTRDSSFLFLFKFPDPDDLEMGYTAVSPTGRMFSGMLYNKTPIDRRHETVANVVRCRPIQWELDGKPSRLPYNNDYVTEEPSPGQIRECASRYTDDMLDKFSGHTIVALGRTPIRYMMGRPLEISKYRGTIFEPGSNLPCDECFGEGRVEGKDIKCKSCRDGIRKCPHCSRWAVPKSCPDHQAPPCGTCSGNGTVPGKPKRCPMCEGAGEVSADPNKPFVCKKLKPDQLLFITYDPAYLLRNPTMRQVVETDFSRIHRLREELVEVEDVTYEQYPDSAPWLEQAQMLSIDLETSGSFDPHQGDIRCWAATDKPGRGAAFRANDPLLATALRCPTIIGQNWVLYDWWWIHHKGYQIPAASRVVDTRYLAKLYNPDTPNNLVYLAGEYATPKLQGYWKTKNDYRDGIEKVACIDVDVTLRVYHGLRDRLEASGQWGLVDSYIVPLSRVLFDMRVGGMRIDPTQMMNTGKILESTLTEIRSRFPWKKDNGSGSEFQHAKVKQYLYDTLGLPIQKTLGKPTTDRDARDELILRLETEHASVRHVSSEDSSTALAVLQDLNDAGEASKLSTSFMHYKFDDEDFIHPALNMGGSARGKHEPGKGTATWRLSCTDPNAQQVPPAARSLFIPDNDESEIISVDLVQAEIVVILWYAEAWGVLDDVLRHNRDAYSAVASLVVGRDIDKKTDPKIRDAYKTNTLAGAYGERPATIAKRLGITRKEAEEILASIYKVLPGLEEYRSSTIAHSRTKGYVQSVFGFRRIIQALEDTGRAANMACNMPVQNVPPVVLCRAMIGLASDLPEGARILMQVHDELVLSSPRAKRDEVLSCVRDWIRAPIPELAAPPIGMHDGLRFNVDVAVGPTWGDLTDVHGS